MYKKFNTWYWKFYVGQEYYLFISASESIDFVAKLLFGGNFAMILALFDAEYIFITAIAVSAPQNLCRCISEEHLLCGLSVFS